MGPTSVEVMPEPLSPHEAAPQQLKDVFKSFRSYPSGEQPSKVVDFQRLDIPYLDSIPLEQYQSALDSFCESTTALQLEREANLRACMLPELGYMRISAKRAKTWDNRELPSSLFDHIQTYGRPQTEPNEYIEPDARITDHPKAASAYHSRKIPGLFVLPSLLPPTVQRKLLYCLLHRDLSNPKHQTNLRAHYNVSYPPSCHSFFSLDKSWQICQPKDPDTHKPLTVSDVLSKKLKWITLGGQYDWTKKEYPEGPAPDFPPDIAKLIRDLFPEVEPEAAIVNIYSPGDSLSLHRDVSEESDCGLVSISLGCEGLFFIALPNEDTGGFEHMAIRLRSGDALYMSGKSRFAWHGLVKVFPFTCPNYLGDWPGGEHFPSWMNDKRINISIRQMRHTVLKAD